MNPAISKGILEISDRLRKLSEKMSKEAEKLFSNPGFEDLDFSKLNWIVCQITVGSAEVQSDPLINDAIMAFSTNGEDAFEQYPVTIMHAILCEKGRTVFNNIKQMGPEDLMMEYVDQPPSDDRLIVRKFCDEWRRLYPKDLRLTNEEIKDQLTDLANKEYHKYFKISMD